MGNEVAVTAFVGDAHGVGLLLLDHRLVLGSGEVFAGGVLVSQGFDRLQFGGGFVFGGHEAEKNQAGSASESGVGSKGSVGGDVSVVGATAAWGLR